MNSFKHNLFARIITLYLLQSNDILSPSLTADLQALGYKSWPRYSALRDALVLPRWIPAPPQKCSWAAHRPVNGGGRKSIGTRRVRLVTTTAVSFSLAMCGRYGTAKKTRKITGRLLGVFCYPGFRLHFIKVLNFDDHPKLNICLNTATDLIYMIPARGN
ncbi:hypothetical protein DFH09DRAFT_1073169 [Mycena vulgaris]|nr:hypothetical protein DFH09DRAFT_1073169 [Mycena vulgaris]